MHEVEELLVTLVVLTGGEQLERKCPADDGGLFEVSECRQIRSQPRFQVPMSLGPVLN